MRPHASPFGPIPVYLVPTKAGFDQGWFWPRPALAKVAPKAAQNRGGTVWHMFPPMQLHGASYVFLTNPDIANVLGDMDFDSVMV